MFRMTPRPAPAPAQPPVETPIAPMASAPADTIDPTAFLIPPAEAAAAELSLEPETPIDFEAMEREWQEAGSLSEDSYARLARAGIPGEIVDAYVEGQLAMGQALRAELLEPIGGEEGFAALAAWAAQSLPAADLDAYEAALQGTPEQAKLALRGLYAAYQDSAARRPALVGGRRTEGGEEIFASAQQLAEAIRDPRYRKDPAYRDAVQARLARSNVFGRR